MLCFLKPILLLDRLMLLAPLNPVVMLLLQVLTCLHILVITSVNKDFLLTKACKIAVKTHRGKTCLSRTFWLCYALIITILALISLSQWCIFIFSLPCFLFNVFKDNNSSWEHFQSGECKLIVTVPVSFFSKPKCIVSCCCS